MRGLGMLAIENPQLVDAETGQRKRDRLTYPTSADHSDGTMRGGGDEPTDSSRKTSRIDRKSTRLNSSHMSISYAVFCLKKKKKIIVNRRSLKLQKTTGA